jgi:hypothetical protein
VKAHPTVLITSSRIIIIIHLLGLAPEGWYCSGIHAAVQARYDVNTQAGVRSASFATSERHEAFVIHRTRTAERANQCYGALLTCRAASVVPCSFRLAGSCRSLH